MLCAATVSKVRTKTSKGLIRYCLTLITRTLMESFTAVSLQLWYETEMDKSFMYLGLSDTNTSTVNAPDMAWHAWTNKQCPVTSHQHHIHLYTTCQLPIKDHVKVKIHRFQIFTAHESNVECIFIVVSTVASSSFVSVSSQQSVLSQCASLCLVTMATAARAELFLMRGWQTDSLPDSVSRAVLRPGCCFFFFFLHKAPPQPTSKCRYPWRT